MKKIMVIAFLLMGFTLTNAQKYLTKEGNIELYSKTPLLVIDGKSQTAGSIIDAANGDVVATVLITSFKFKEALLEEHFNENYLESDKYPKAQFKGKISNWSSVNVGKNGTYPITIEGDLTIHGVTKPIKAEGKLVVSGDKLKATTEFYVSLESYNIRVEESYKDRIPDKIKLTLDFDYAKMGN